MSPPWCSVNAVPFVVPVSELPSVCMTLTVLGAPSTVMLSGPMQAFLIGVGGGAGVGGRGGRGAGSGPRQTQISSA